MDGIVLWKVFDGSPLHSGVEALIWALKCMRNLRHFQVIFAMDYSQPVKMVLELGEWPVFASYLEDIKILKECFHSSKIIYVPRTQNTRVGCLARSATKQPSFVVHMDAEL